ncbi:hypothetical protein BESB_070710 [Besnoitia besnoiti]|uniref:Uncharacterized protein n=1 Tax=Besnoitia besnoiti TaxID=94643 RepID=A0A2A9M7K7_BESBE|nr:uncharacterized protein BESB_070710 [Besnoitia besnoiti]PFH33919.1 hypothetical protein BESB_070710 [Besnoitia besnoiti]
MAAVSDCEREPEGEVGCADASLRAGGAENVESWKSADAEGALEMVDSGEKGTSEGSSRQGEPQDAPAGAGFETECAESHVDAKHTDGAHGKEAAAAAAAEGGGEKGSNVPSCVDSLPTYQQGVGAVSAGKSAGENAAVSRGDSSERGSPALVEAEKSSVKLLPSSSPDTVAPSSRSPSPPRNSACTPLPVCLSQSSPPPAAASSSSPSSSSFSSSSACLEDDEDVSALFTIEIDGDLSLESELLLPAASNPATPTASSSSCAAASAGVSFEKSVSEIVDAEKVQWEKTRRGLGAAYALLHARLVRRLVALGALRPCGDARVCAAAVSVKRRKLTDEGVSAPAARQSDGERDATPDAQDDAAAERPTSAAPLPPPRSAADASVSAGRFEICVDLLAGVVQDAQLASARACQRGWSRCVRRVFARTGAVQENRYYALGEDGERCDGRRSLLPLSSALLQQHWQKTAHAAADSREQPPAASCADGDSARAHSWGPLCAAESEEGDALFCTLRVRKDAAAAAARAGDAGGLGEEERRTLAFTWRQWQRHHCFLLATHQSATTTCFFCGKLACPRSENPRIPCPASRCEQCCQRGHRAFRHACNRSPALLHSIEDAFEDRYSASMKADRDEVRCVRCRARGHFLCGEAPASEGFSTLDVRVCTRERNRDARQNSDPAFVWTLEEARRYLARLPAHVRQRKMPPPPPPSATTGRAREEEDGSRCGEAAPRRHPPPLASAAPRRRLQDLRGGWREREGAADGDPRDERGRRPHDAPWRHDADGRADGARWREERDERRVRESRTVVFGGHSGDRGDALVFSKPAAHAPLPSAAAAAFAPAATLPHPLHAAPPLAAVPLGAPFPLWGGGVHLPAPPHAPPAAAAPVSFFPPAIAAAPTAEAYRVLPPGAGEAWGARERRRPPPACAAAAPARQLVAVAAGPRPPLRAGRGGAEARARRSDWREDPQARHAALSPSRSVASYAACGAPPSVRSDGCAPQGLPPPRSSAARQFPLRGARREGGGDERRRERDKRPAGDANFGVAWPLRR